MTTGKQVFSTITSDGQLELGIANVEIKAPGPDDVLVRIEAAPINPSDMGPLFGPASIAEAKLQDAKLIAPVPENRLGMVASRLDQTLPVGNECAGTVVSTGESDAAKALDGKLVSIMPGAPSRNTPVCQQQPASFIMIKRHHSEQLRLSSTR